MVQIAQDFLLSLSLSIHVTLCQTKLNIGNIISNEFFSHYEPPYFWPYMKTKLNCVSSGEPNDKDARVQNLSGHDRIPVAQWRSLLDEYSYALPAMG